MRRREQNRPDMMRTRSRLADARARCLARAFGPPYFGARSSRKTSAFGSWEAGFCSSTRLCIHRHILFRLIIAFL